MTRDELVTVPPRVFHSSTNWGDAGLSIEREQIELLSDFGRWDVRVRAARGLLPGGSSPFVTAMRAYLTWE
jgi:hypothetical protein